MDDSVNITFTADIADLQRGLQQATAAVNEVTATMKAGATAVALSYSDITRAYSAGIQQRLDLVRSGSDTELAIARSGDKAQTDILLDSLKMRENAVKASTQIALLSHEDERADLLGLEADREAVELRHLTFLQSTYRDNAAAYANVQRQIDELAAQSALRRQAVELTYLRQVDADYRSTFDGIASSVSQQVTGLISGQESLRQATAHVLLSMIQDFVAARLKIVADWAAGMLAETVATQTSEAAKTQAVLAGTAARTSAAKAGTAASTLDTIGSIAKSIVASAAETFAGIFGFLSPVLGPAAAGPAAAGEATVLAAKASLPSFAVGAWELPADMVAQVHRGEMIVPASAAGTLRSAISGAGDAPNVSHQTHFNVTTLDAAGVRRFFATHSRAILAAIDDGVRNGSHLGFRQVGRL